MNKKALVALGLSILLGIISVFLVNQYIKNKEKTIYAGMELVTVIAAVKEIPAGATISKDMFSPRKVPEKFVHGNAIAPKDFNLLVGQTLNFPLKRRDTLLWSDLGKQAVKGRWELADRVTKGERALSIAVDNISGVSGFLRPNDRIDLLGTFRSQEDGTEATITLLQNMTIMATGTSMSGMGVPPGNYGTLTLLVTLEEAELLIFAQRQGQLIATLRNPEDLETFEDIPKVTFSNIMKTDFRDKIQKKRNAIEVIKKGQILEQNK